MALRQQCTLFHSHAFGINPLTPQAPFLARPLIPHVLELHNVSHHNSKYKMGRINTNYTLTPCCIKSRPTLCLNSVLCLYPSLGHSFAQALGFFTKIPSTNLCLEFYPKKGVHLSSHNLATFIMR